MAEIDDSRNYGIIDLNTPIKPAILAGILNIPVSMISQGRQDGKLPARTDATYRECIHQYIGHYKSKMAAKSSTMYDAKIEQDIRLNRAKEEMQLLEIKKTKQQLADVQELKELFEPIFHIIKSSLVNLSRKNPSIQVEIDNMLESWYVLGTKITEKAKQDANAYVTSMLEKDIDLPEAEEVALNKFGIDELL